MLIYEIIPGNFNDIKTAVLATNFTLAELPSYYLVLYNEKPSLLYYFSLNTCNVMLVENFDLPINLFNLFSQKKISVVSL